MKERIEPSAKIDMRLKMLWLTLAAPAAWGLQKLAGLFPGTVESFYVRLFYLPVTRTWSRITGIVPLSVAEIGLMALALSVLSWCVAAVVRSIRLRSFRPIVRKLVILLSLGCVWYALTVLLWNLNYAREPVSDLLGLEIRDSSVAELEELCVELRDRANLLRVSQREGTGGTMMLSDHGSAFLDRTAKGYEALSGEYGFLGGRYGDPKPVILSRWMSETHIIGIYTITTAEANVDVDIPPMMQPSTAMHELAHMRGFAREDEANYLSWLSCSAHPDADFRYSGTMLALIHSTNALSAADQGAWNRVASGYSAGVERDLELERTYWSHFDSPVKKVAETANDTYLKMNGQADGTRSYGRMVDLLLAERRAGGHLK